MKKIYYLSLFMICLSSCHLITGEVTINEKVFDISTKLFAAEKDMELVMSQFASEVLPDQHNQYCYTTEENIGRYELLHQVEKSGMLETYKTGQIAVYTSDTEEVEVISIEGDFPIPRFFNQGTTVGTIQEKIIKRVTYKGQDYAVISYPNQSKEYSYSCSSSSGLAEPVTLKTKLIIFKGLDLPERLFQKFIEERSFSGLGYIF